MVIITHPSEGQENSDVAGPITCLSGSVVGVSGNVTMVGIGLPW